DEPTLAMATLDGEFISAEGVVFGGSSNVRSDSLLERRARVAALAKEETEYAIRRETLLQKRDQIKASVEAAGGQLDESRAHYQAAQLAHSTSTTKISLLAREEAEAARKIDNLKSEKAALEQQVKSADERIAELETEIGALR